MLRVYGDRWPRLGERVYVDVAATVIGDVSLGDDVSVWPQAVVRGDVNRIVVGAETNLQDACVLHVTQDSPFQPGGFPLLIGSGVTVGHRAVLHGCTIGDQCLIGIGAVIMDGCVLEDRLMVAAGALVPPRKRLESGWLYVGSPVRQSRLLNAQELEFLTFSKNGYVKLKEAYRLSADPWLAADAQ